MGTYRMYTGDDGETHWEAIDLAATPDWTSGLPTIDITFREIPVGNFVDWHPAPRRQFVIILSGQLEIGFSDGTTKGIRPRRRPPRGGHNRQRPHHRRPRRRALRDRHRTAGLARRAGVPSP